MGEIHRLLQLEATKPVTLLLVAGPFHMAAVALNYFAYNFCKIHTSLRMTPAMAAGVVTRLMDISDLVKLLIESEQEKAA